MMQTDVKTSQIEQARREFDAGIKQIKRELQELVERTIKQVDEKQTQKILKKIQEL